MIFYKIDFIQKLLIAFLWTACSVVGYKQQDSGQKTYLKSRSGTKKSFIRTKKGLPKKTKSVTKSVKESENKIITHKKNKISKNVKEITFFKITRKNEGKGKGINQNFIPKKAKKEANALPVEINKHNILQSHKIDNTSNISDKKLPDSQANSEIQSNKNCISKPNSEKIVYKQGISLNERQFKVVTQQKKVTGNNSITSNTINKAIDLAFIKQLSKGIINSTNKRKFEEKLKEIEKKYKDMNRNELIEALRKHIIISDQAALKSNKDLKLYAKLNYLGTIGILIGITGVILALSPINVILGAIISLFGFSAYLINNTAQNILYAKKLRQIKKKEVKSLSYKKRKLNDI